MTNIIENMAEIIEFKVTPINKTKSRAVSYFLFIAC